ncbi:MAG: AarF/ABC1/UbiB kinase family protein [Deltaproteobacteria bacterium]|nr:AarF/ABC1/UbiB kinase family protein [Deltaproteobacteria bacterium]
MTRKRSLFKLGTLAVRGAAKRLVGDRAAADRALGEALASELDAMKGMAMKLGQIISYMEVPFPDELQGALARLQTGVEGVPIDVVREVVRAHLGGELEELFEAFEPEPIAAASIGQVHRARVHGAPVAVKVQYPDVQGSFDEDMKRIERIASLASLATVVDGKAIAAELGARLHEECDYRTEARWQRTFAAAVEPLHALGVPAVVEDRTGDGVLTTAWDEGLSLSAFMESASQGAKERAARALASFAWHGIFVWQTLHADPHPGNFLFSPEGEVTVLDFGCVKRFEPSFCDAWRRTLLTVIDGEGDFEQATRDTGMVGGKRFDYGAHRAMIEWLVRPYSRERFTFTRAYNLESLEWGKPTSSHARSMDVPAPWIWFARATFGLHSVLSRMGAEGDFRSALLEPLRAGPARLALLGTASLPSGV